MCCSACCFIMLVFMLVWCVISLLLFYGFVLSWSHVSILLVLFTPLPAGLHVRVAVLLVGYLCLLDCLFVVEVLVECLYVVR